MQFAQNRLYFNIRELHFTPQGQIDLFLLFKVALFYRRHRITPCHARWWQGKLFKDLARTPSHIFILVVHVCPNLLWAHCHVDQAGENAYCISIAVVTLYRLLSHLQISPKIKEGGERRGKEWRRQRKFLKKSAPEISSMFKKNASLKK